MTQVAAEPARGDAAPAPTRSDIFGAATTELARAGAGRHHYPALDGLRGAAILLVLICHYSGAAGLIGLRWVWLYPAGNGWVGVDLFFVLSGFLITGILYDSRGMAHRFRNFYARRVLRIFPLYFGVLAITLLLLLAMRSLAPSAFASKDPQSLWAAMPWLWTYTVNILMATGRPPWFFGHFWTLSIEEQFYLFWPLVVLLLPRRAIVATATAILLAAPLLRLLLSGLGASGSSVYVLTPCRVDSLAAGALVALLLRSPGPPLLPRMQRLARSVFAVGGPVMLILLAGFPIAARCIGRGYPHASLRLDQMANGRWSRDLQYSALALLFSSALVLALDVRGLLGRMLCWRPMRAIGGYSYGIYVFHFPILGLLLLAEAPGRPLYPLRTAGAIGYLAFIGLNVLVTFSLAFASFHLYEKRFLKLKRHFPEVAAKSDHEGRPAGGSPSRVAAGGTV